MSSIKSNADLSAMGNANFQVQVVNEMRAARDASLERVTKLYHPDGNKNSLATPDQIQRLTPAAVGDVTQINFNNTNNYFGGSASPSSEKLGCCCPREPTPADNGGLKKDEAGVITTPGGYKIEATKQHEWKITGPDGKETKVWGDPHVAEGDGGKWDFKRDSTFVLGDGTKVNCKTTPWADGKMTVTSGLEVIAGNDRVEINGIDKGKGEVGEITKDGYAHANSFGKNDVFVMGKESDDWSFQGKEVEGSENGGESFKLGKELEAGVVKPLVDKTKAEGTPANYMSKVFDSLTKIFESLKEVLSANQKPEASTSAPHNCWTPHNDDAARNVGSALRSIGTMFQRLADLLDLQSSVKPRPVQY